MKRIVLGPELSDLFRAASAQSEVIDPNGNKLGIFTPEQVGHECRLSPEELDEIKKQQGW